MLALALFDCGVCGRLEGSGRPWPLVWLVAFRAGVLAGVRLVGLAGGPVGGVEVGVLGAFAKRGAMGLPDAEEEWMGGFLSSASVT